MSETKVRKYILQYSYLLLEKEEVFNTCIEQEKNICKYIKEHHPDAYKKIYSSHKDTAVADNTSSKTEETEEKEEPNNSEEKQSKNKDLRLLYRKIAAKTHPDKTKDEQLHKKFSQAADAYAKNDIASLLNIAGYLNIEILKLSVESVALLEKNISTLNEEINNKKGTVAWRFSQAASKEEKEIVIQAVINKMIGE
tara:strand:- start:791 stop:1378 length:588 start_codon:yes stop_codon:yes gene_type:complete